VRGTSWITLFSPRNRDYDVTVVPRPLHDAGTGPIARPSAGFERLLGWFAPPDPRLGGGSTGRMSLSAARYGYSPEAQAEWLRGVRIPIWSTKSFTARWNGPLDAPLIESDLASSGADRVEGTLTNQSDRTLRDAVLIFGGQVYDQLGTISPGASVQINYASRTRPLAGYLEEAARVSQVAPGAPYPVQPAVPVEGAAEDRVARLVRVMMFRDGMNPKTATPPSLPLHDLDLTGQLALERPMLVARTDAPGADLRLDDNAPKPQFEQTSVIRIILPLRKEK
jgi:hypothetical protein